MIGIVDYGVGNLTSIQNMLKKVGTEVKIVSQAADVLQASKIILPGMGHFDSCMQKFNKSGLRTSIEKMVFDNSVPVLGICVGLQMFMQDSEEGDEKGLQWVKGNVARFNISKMEQPQKIPNMGWLDVQREKSSGLAQGLDGARFYFAHSYHVILEDEISSLFTSKYGYQFTAAIEKGNILGVQFHPEKSHRFGLQLLENFALNY